MEEKPEFISEDNVRFCHNVVRSIVAGLSEVGSTGTFDYLARCRPQLAQVVKSMCQGLCFIEVDSTCDNRVHVFTASGRDWNKEEQAAE